MQSSPHPPRTSVLFTTSNGRSYAMFTWRLAASAVKWDPSVDSSGSAGVPANGCEKSNLCGNLVTLGSLAAIVLVIWSIMGFGGGFSLSSGVGYSLLT